jgi:hypothetical protein
MCAEKCSRVREGTCSGALHIKPFKSVDMIRGQFTLIESLMRIVMTSEDLCPIATREKPPLGVLRGARCTHAWWLSWSAD